MAYNLKITQYENEIQVAFYDYIVNERGDKNEENNKTNKVSTAHSQQSAWTDSIFNALSPFDIKDYYTQDDVCDDWLQDTMFDTIAAERNQIAMAKKSAYQLRDSMSRTIKTIYEITRANSWEWFCTFTFSGDKVNRYDYTSCVKVLRKWLDNQRTRYAPDLKYVIVPELHKDGAYHFHSLMSNICDIPINKADTLNQYILYNFTGYTMGFNSLERVRDSNRASNYITKYITKDLCKLTDGRHRYISSRNCTRPDTYKMQVENLEGALSQLTDYYGFAPEVTYVKQVNNPYVDSKITYLQCKLDSKYC